MACVTFDSRLFHASYWNDFVISPIELNIFLNAISCTTVQIADCLLLTLSEGLSGSVFDCSFGMNLDKCFKTPMNYLSCFRVLGGVRFKTDSIFESFGRIPSESLSKRSQLIFSLKHHIYFPLTRNLHQDVFVERFLLFYLDLNVKFLLLRCTLLSIAF